MPTQDFPLTTMETSTGLYHIVFANRLARLIITHFIFTSVCNSIMNFLLLSCQKDPVGVQSSWVPLSQDPAELEREKRVFLISAYVRDTFNEAINSLIYVTKYVPDYNNFQSLPIWRRFKPVVDIQTQFENQNHLSNQIFQLQTMSKFSSQKPNVYMCWLKIT